MSGAIRYSKFSGYYDNFDEWKENTNVIARHKGILKYLTKNGRFKQKKIQKQMKIKSRHMEENPGYGISCYQPGRHTLPERLYFTSIKF